MNRSTSSKPTLLIISDTIRADLHQPLGLFRYFEVIHAYRQASYQDMTKRDFAAVRAIPFRNPVGLIKLMKTHKPTIIQLPEPTAGRRAALTSMVLLGPARTLGAKIVVPFFENVPLEEKFRGLTFTLIEHATKRIIKAADLLIYLNNGALDNLRKLGAPKQQLKRLFWGSWGTAEYFRPNENLKLKNEKLKIVLYVGVISKRKGIAYLVEAMEQVRERVPDARLWLVGPSGDFKPPQKSWIKVFGPVKNRELPKLFQRATIFTLPSITTPSWREQVGMVNLQALACATPVVTTRSGAIPEFVREGQGVVLVPEGSATALSSGILRILKLSHRARSQFGSHGRRWVARRYNLKENISTAEQVLVNLL